MDAVSPLTPTRDQHRSVAASRGPSLSSTSPRQGAEVRVAGAAACPRLSPPHPIRAQGSGCCSRPLTEAVTEPRTSRGQDWTLREKLPVSKSSPTKRTHRGQLLLECEAAVWTDAPAPPGLWPTAGQWRELGHRRHTRAHTPTCTHTPHHTRSACMHLRGKPPWNLLSLCSASVP